MAAAASDQEQTAPRRAEVQSVLVSSLRNAGAGRSCYVQAGELRQLVLVRCDRVEPMVVKDFIERLAERVAGGLQLRVAVHHGRARYGTTGFYGPAPAEAIRLLDSVSDADGDLVVIVSDSACDDVLLPDDFVRMRTSYGKAWTFGGAGQRAEPAGNHHGWNISTNGPTTIIERAGDIHSLIVGTVNESRADKDR